MITTPAQRNCPTASSTAAADVDQQPQERQHVGMDLRQRQPAHNQWMILPHDDADDARVRHSRF